MLIILDTQSVFVTYFLQEKDAFDVANFSNLKGCT